MKRDVWKCKGNCCVCEKEYIQGKIFYFLQGILRLGNFSITGMFICYKRWTSVICQINLIILNVIALCKEKIIREKNFLKNFWNSINIKLVFHNSVRVISSIYIYNYKWWVLQYTGNNPLSGSFARNFSPYLDFFKQSWSRIFLNILCKI